MNSCQNTEKAERTTISTMSQHVAVQLTVLTYNKIKKLTMNKRLTISGLE